MTFFCLCCFILFLKMFVPFLQTPSLYAIEESTEDFSVGSPQHGAARGVQDLEKQQFLVGEHTPTCCVKQTTKWWGKRMKGKHEKKKDNVVWGGIEKEEEELFML